MIEEAEEELNQRIFEEDEIGQYSFAADTSNQLGETTLIGLKNRQAVTVNDKVTALQTSYEDPFSTIMAQLQT